MSSVQSQPSELIQIKRCQTDILHARACSWEIQTLCSSLAVFGQSAWLWKETGVASPVPEEQLAAKFGRLQFALDDWVGLRTGSWMVGVLREGTRGRHFGHLWKKRNTRVTTSRTQCKDTEAAMSRWDVSVYVLSLSDANRAGYHLIRQKHWGCSFVSYGPKLRLLCRYQKAKNSPYHFSI